MASDAQAESNRGIPRRGAPWPADVVAHERLERGQPHVLASRIPDDVGFATKPQIARRMIARAIAAKVPFSFVAADSVYGTGDIETMLRKAGKGYVLGVASNHVFHSWGKKQLVGGTAAKIAQNLPKNAWRRLSSGVRCWCP